MVQLPLCYTELINLVISMYNSTINTYNGVGDVRITGHLLNQKNQCWIHKRWKVDPVRNKLGRSTHTHTTIHHNYLRLIVVILRHLRKDLFSSSPVCTSFYCYNFAIKTKLKIPSQFLFFIHISASSRPKDY